MRVLIFGSRPHKADDGFNEWATSTIRAEVEALDRHNLIVIHGNAEGADREADFQCRRLAIHTAKVDALWHAHNRAAGLIRNATMLLLQPEFAIGIWDGTSPGTKDMADRAERAGIPVVLRTWNP